MTEKPSKVIPIWNAKIKDLVWCPRCSWGGLLKEEPEGGYWCGKCMHRWTKEDE